MLQAAFQRRRAGPSSARTYILYGAHVNSEKPQTAVSITDRAAIAYDNVAQPRLRRDMPYVYAGARGAAAVDRWRRRVGGVTRVSVSSGVAFRVQ